MNVSSESGNLGGVSSVEPVPSSGRRYRSPPGGEASPKRSGPQQSTVPPDRRPQPWPMPTVTETRAASSGGARPLALELPEPQQLMAPCSRRPQAWVMLSESEPNTRPSVAPSRSSPKPGILSLPQQVGQTVLVEAAGVGRPAGNGDEPGAARWGGLPEVIALRSPTVYRAVRLKAAGMDPAAAQLVETSTFGDA